MLVIGHRGAKGLDHENTLAAMQTGVEAGALILEFDIRLTKDHVPVVIHDRSLTRTHALAHKVDQLTFRQLSRLTAQTAPVPSLAQVLDAYWGVVFLNIEIKSRHAGQAVVALLKKQYITTPSDWGNCFISSFSPRELRSLRKASPDVQLGLLHNRNPFAFVAYTRQLKLSAVGFHRLYVHPLAVEIAQKSHLFTYAYTVNRPKGAVLLAHKQLDAVVTDHPDRISHALEKNQLLS